METKYQNALICSEYAPSIVLIIDNSKGRYISHGDLADKLKISKSNLSNVIKRLEPYDLFIVEKQGRNKYYRLSSKGYEFYHYLLEENSINYYKRAKELLDNHKI